MTPIDVLFLCETNAATSLMAEAIVNHRGDPRIRAFSAGRVPAERPLSEALSALAARAIPVDALEPKAWSIFALPGARRPDLVVDLATVTWTDSDIAGLCAQPVLRWPLRDPSLVESRAERRPVTEAVLQSLIGRIESELMRRAGLPPVLPATGYVPAHLTA